MHYCRFYIVAITKFGAPLIIPWNILPIKPKFLKSDSNLEKLMSIEISWVRIFPSRSTATDALPFAITFVIVTVNGPLADENSVESV